MLKIFILCFSFTSCSLFYTERLQVVKPKENKGRVGIGLIENRDMGFNIFIVKNFIDMLQLEILKNNFMPLKVSQYKALQNFDNKNRKKSKESSDYILPDKIRKGLIAAGQKESFYLGKDDIAKISKKNSLKFFIQGAIGRSSGDILEEENNGIIFIFLYDSSGQKIAAANYNISGKNLGNGPYLQEVCKKIIQNLFEKIKSK